jgi:hypothetical protein
VLCLIDAPTKEAAMAIHRAAHGPVAHQLVQVAEGV